MRRIIKRTLGFYGMRRPLSILILALVDALALFAGLAFAGYLVGGGGRLAQILPLLPIMVVVWIAVFAAHDLYDRATNRRNPGALIGAILWGAGLLVFGSAIYQESGYGLGEVLLASAVALLVSGGLRTLYERVIERIYRQGLGRVPTILVGEPASRTRVRDVMETKPGSYACVGEMDLPDGGGVDLAGLRAMLDRTGARNLVLTGAEKLGDAEFLNLLRSMRLRKVRVEVAPGAVTLMGSTPVLSENMGLPLLEVGYPRLDNTQRALKRMLDVGGSALGLLVLSPLLLGVAALIKFTSPGPVFFKQKRVGADEKVFLCYKFRSMYSDAEARQAELEARNEADGAIFKMQNDPRVTPIGRFIRRWSIDELPQLINVLRGEMSLVGPRPLPIRDFEKMTARHKMRLAAIPGCSGYWQISGRSNLSFEDMIRLDLYYIENWSLGLDVKIILKTVHAVIRHEGAY